MASFLIDGAQHKAGFLTDEKETEAKSRKKKIKEAWERVEDASAEIKRLQKARPKTKSDINVRTLALQGRIDDMIGQTEFKVAKLMQDARKVEELVEKEEEKDKQKAREAAQQQVHILFKKYDKDMSGELDEKELALLLADLGHSGVTRVGLGNKIQEAYRGMIHDVMSSIDEDGDGTCSVEELTEWYLKRDGVGTLTDGQIEDAELARFCVSQLVQLVKAVGETEAGQPKLADAAGVGIDETPEAEEAKDQARKKKWTMALGNTKKMLGVGLMVKANTTNNQMENKLDNLKGAAQTIKKVLGRMQMQSVENVFLAWSDHVKVIRKKILPRYKCMKPVSIRVGEGLTSMKMGELHEGDEIEVIEVKPIGMGIKRLRYALGWVSDKSFGGGVCLEEITYTKTKKSTSKFQKQIVLEDKAKKDKGTLSITVIEAKGLPKTDLFGSVDPFALVRCSGDTKRTQTVRNNRAPSWGTQFEFPKVSLETAFTLEVYDYDLTGDDDLLGSVNMVVKDLTATRSVFRATVDRWYTLEPAKGLKVDAQMEIHLQCEFLSDRSADKDTYSRSDAVMSRRPDKFVLSTEAPPWKVMAIEVVPLMVTNDMSIRTAMASFVRFLVEIREARDAIVEHDDGMYNLLVLFSTFHPPIKRDCVHALVKLTREIPGMADRILHKLKWSAVSPLLALESPDSIIGASRLLTEIVSNVGPDVRRVTIEGMIRSMDLPVLARNLRRAKFTQITNPNTGTVGPRLEDAPELALPTLALLSTVVVPHPRARAEWCRSEEACRLLIWHIENGPIRVKRAASDLCAQFAAFSECQATMYENGLSLLAHRSIVNKIPYDRWAVVVKPSDEEIRRIFFLDNPDLDMRTKCSLGCIACRLGCNTQNQAFWVRANGLSILKELVQFENREVGASCALLLSCLAASGHLTMVKDGVRTFTAQAEDFLGPLGTLCNIPDANVQQYANATVWSLSVKLDDLTVLVELGGIPVVFPMLTTSSHRTQAWAANYLVDRVKQEDLQDYFVERSNYLAMLKCARTTAVKKTRDDLEDTIAHVCEDPVRRDKSFELGTYYTLQILARYDTHLIWCAKQLYELSISEDADAEVSRHVCGVQGGFGAIPMLCKSGYFPNEEPSAENTAAALANFAAVRSLHPHLLKAGAAGPIVMLVVHPSDYVRTNASQALVSLASAENKTRIGLEEHVSLKDMRVMLASEHEVVATATMTAMSRLTIHPLSQVQCANLGIFGSVLSTVALVPNSRPPALSLLRNMCRCSVGQKQVAENHLWQPLLACRLSTDETQQVWSIKTLVGIFNKTKQTEFLRMLKNEYCMEMIMEAFKLNDRSTVVATIRALGRLVATCVIAIDSSQFSGGHKFQSTVDAEGAREFIANSGMMKEIDKLLRSFAHIEGATWVYPSTHDVHSYSLEPNMYDDAIGMEVMNLIAFVSACPSGFYSDAGRLGLALPRALPLVVPTPTGRPKPERDCWEWRKGDGHVIGCTNRPNAWHTCSSFCAQFLKDDVIRRPMVAAPDAEPEMPPLAKSVEAIRCLYKVFERARAREFVSIITERQQYAVQLTALRTLAVICRDDVERNDMTALCSLDELITQCSTCKVPVRLSFFKILLEVSRSEINKAALGNDNAFIKRMVTLSRVALGQSRVALDETFGVLAVHFDHVEALAARTVVKNDLLREDGALARHLAAVAKAEDKVETGPNPAKIKAMEDLQAQTPEFEAAQEVANAAFVAWHDQMHLFRSVDVCLAVLRDIHSDEKVQAWFLHRLTMLLHDKENDWELGIDPKYTLGTERIDQETVASLLQFGNSLDMTVVDDFGTMMLHLASDQKNHGHIVTAHAIPALAVLCEEPPPDRLAREKIKETLRLMLYNFAVMKYFEGRDDAYQMIILVSQVYADDEVVQRWASELLAKAPNPAKLTLQIISQDYSNLEDELNALEALSRASDPGVRLNCATRIHALCLSNSKVRAQLCQAGGARVIQMLLESEEVPTQVLALEALKSLANDSVCRDPVLQKQLDILDVVASLLGSGVDQVKVLCMEVCAGISAGDKDTQEDMKRYLKNTRPVERSDDTLYKDVVDTGEDGTAITDRPSSHEDPDSEKTDTRTEIEIDLENRRVAGLRRANKVMNALMQGEGSWPVLLRATGANLPRGLAPAQPAARLVICAVAPTETGRMLLEGDSSLYSLVCYIENGDDRELKYWCNERLAINAAAQDMTAPKAKEDETQLLSATSQALVAKALVHLIRPIGTPDVKLRHLCLNALNVQLVDTHARKECVHLPLMIQLQECVKFGDAVTRTHVCNLFNIMSKDKSFDRRLSRKGYFNTVAAMCVEIGQPKTDAFSRQIGKEVMLRLLEHERADAREAAVHGNALIAFVFAIESGNIELQRWCVISLVELSKVVLQKDKQIQRKKAAAVIARKKMLIKVSKVDRAVVDDEAWNESMVEAYVNIVLPLIQDGSTDDTVQAFCVEVMRYLCQAHTEFFHGVGVNVFETLLHLLEDSATHTQIECCRTIDVLVENGHIDISTEQFTSLNVYSQQRAGSGAKGWVDINAMNGIPLAMQSWLGGLLPPVPESAESEAVDARIDGGSERPEGSLESALSKKNPHQLLLAVAVPLLESFVSEARIAALSLMRSLASKFPQFRIRMHLHDILPSVMRLALSSGNEMIFRNAAVSLERDIARNILCHLCADEVTRQALVSGWKITGILLIVEAYGAVMMGIIEDDADLRSHKGWLATALTEQAVNDPASRRPIAKKALTVLLHLSASSDVVVRHAAVRCIATVLHEKDDRDATAASWNMETCTKEMLRHLHIRGDPKLQRLIDDCLLGLLRDVKYVETKIEDTNTRSLLLLARSGTVDEKVWVGDTVVTLAEDHMGWSTATSKLTLETLAALIQTNVQTLQVQAGKTLEILVTDVKKHTLLTNSGGLLLLAGLAMSNTSSVQVSGLRALVALSASPGSQGPILDSGIPQLLASTLDVWYTTIMTSGLHNIFGPNHDRPLPPSALATKAAAESEESSAMNGSLSSITALLPPGPVQPVKVKTAADFQIKGMFSKVRGALLLSRLANKVAPAGQPMQLDDGQPLLKDKEDNAGQPAQAEESNLPTPEEPEGAETGKAVNPFLLQLSKKASQKAEEEDSSPQPEDSGTADSKEEVAPQAEDPETVDTAETGEAETADKAGKGEAVNPILLQLSKKVSKKPGKAVTLALAPAGPAKAGEKSLPLGKSAMWKSAKKVSKKAVMLSTLTKSAQGSRAKEQALVLNLTCTVLESLLSCTACNCYRDCVESGILPSLTRTTLITWLHKEDDKYDHPASRTIASIKGVSWWNLGDSHNRGEIRQFPTPYPTIPEPMIMKSLAFGTQHTLALSLCGAVYVTGENTHGQLGLKKSLLSQFARVDTLVSEDVSNIGCGATFSAAVTRDGRLWTWGCNSKGQCGTGFLSAKVEVPQIVPLPRKVLQASGGTTHGALLDEKGQVWTWGEGALGQLGHGDIRPRLTPTRISGANEFIFLACGPSYNVALTQTGKVVTWGDNSEGQLGFSQQHNGCMPAQVDLIADEMVTSIAVGRAHVIAVTVLGAAYSWGDNTDGQLGRKMAGGTTDNFDHQPVSIFLHEMSQLRRVDTGSVNAEEPQDLQHNERVVSVACGDDHTVIVTNAGIAYAIGQGNCGQQGRLDTLCAFTPRLVTTMLPTQHIVGAFCANSGAVLVAVPTTTSTSMMDPAAYAKATQDDYMTDLRVLSKILPGALFPRNRMERQIGTDITDLIGLVHKLVDMHEGLPEFPLVTEIEKPPPTPPLQPTSWTEKSLFAAMVEFDLETEQSCGPFHHHLKSGKHNLQHYVNLYHDKIIEAMDKERARKESEELVRDGDPFENFVDVYSQYSEECLKMMDQAGVYLDNPTEMPPSAHLWPTLARYDTYALGLLAQDFCSDWARQGATERALAGEQISAKIAENLMGRELESLIATLPSCKPRPAALFFANVEHVLSQLGQAWHGDSVTSGHAVYDGRCWGDRAPANIALLNLIALPMQRASLYFEMLRNNLREQTLRGHLQWTDSAPPARKPAVAEIKLDMDFSTVNDEFDSSFVADVAAGLDIPPRRISIARIVAGSVIVTCVVLPGSSKSEPAAEDLVTRLQSKSTDPSSIIRRGAITKAIVGVKPVPISEIPEDLLPKIIEITKKYSKKTDSRFGFGKKKNDKNDNKNAEHQKMEYAMTKFACAQNIEHALEDLGGAADAKPSCCSKMALVIGDTIGARIVDIAAFQKLCDIQTYLPKRFQKKEPPRRGRRKKQHPKAYKYLVPFVLAAVFLSLVFVLSLSDDKAKGVLNLTTMLCFATTVFVAATLFRVRAHSTLNLPVYRATGAASLDLNGANVMAAVALPIEALQHNALALAVALNWSDEMAAPLDGWLWWASRSSALGMAGIAASLALVVWPLSLHAVLGRVTSRIATVEIVLCTMIPWCVLSTHCGVHLPPHLPIAAC